MAVVNDPSTANPNNIFDRNSALSLDQRYDTVIFTKKGGTFTWEIAVPNGSYTVHLVAGDAAYYNSIFKFNAEGILTINGTPTTGNRWIEGTATVTVNDGKLTIANASGANSNKLCYIDIASVEQ